MENEKDIRERFELMQKQEKERAYILSKYEDLPLACLEGFLEMLESLGSKADVLLMQMVKDRVAIMFIEEGLDEAKKNNQIM